MLEYVCAENEKDRVHLVGKPSDDTKNAVQLAPEVLSKYVGTYESQRSGRTALVIKIALEDSGLTVSMGSAANTPLTALGETTFTNPRRQPLRVPPERER